MNLENKMERIKVLLERIISCATFIFPFCEIISYFGPKVFLGTENIVLQNIYSNSLTGLTSFYTENTLPIFVFMIWIFIICSRGSVRLTKYARFNIIQAILLDIICSSIGVIFTYLPIVLRESMLGVIFANFLFLGMLLLIAYCWLLIAFGRYTKIPILTDAAKMQVQQGD